jgi:DNA-binding NarL/FixJ family response regulator
VKSLICCRLAGIVARGIQSPAKNISGKNSMVPITPTARPVGASAAISMPRPSIATELYMSVPTVKAHITHILTKLGLGNRTQIALLAHDANLA